MTKSQRTLSRWGLLMVGDQGPILAGCEGIDISRTSTPLVEFDPETLTGVTASGRPYRLVGPPEPSHALMAFHSLWDSGDVVVRIINPAEAGALIERNAPFQHTPEEQAALDQRKLTHVAAQVRLQMTINGIDEEGAVRRTGLASDQLRGLLDADLSKLSADEADLAFMRLVGAACGENGSHLTAPDCTDDEEQPSPGRTIP